MRNWMWIGVAMVVIAVAGFWLLTHRPSQAPADTSAAPSVQLATVRFGEYDVFLNESGSIGAPAGTTTQLSFPIAGTIGSIDVHVGERVSGGATLATLDTRSLSLTAQQAAADAQAANAQARAAAVDRFSTKLAVDRAAVTRAENLYRAGVSAKKDIDDARAQLASDEADAHAAGADRTAAAAQAQSAAVKAELANTDLSRATLRSPVDGVVTAISRRTGEAVDPTVSVISVGPVQQAQATLQVPSSDASRIAAGDPVELTVTGTSETSMGNVTAVVPSVDPATQAATVVVSGVPAGAVAGNAISAKITVAHARGLLIPQTSIVQDPQSGDNVVFVQAKQKDGSLKFEQRTVAIVHEDGTTAQVNGGVRPGERVAAQGAFELLAPAGGSGD
ncbi:MAG: efflux RND transporter periplasmic adaptor subunit [Candidatus Eremiobacteraeota bacterium]|nr:efflux RND transporter periplasmic adaptor subunit [Candidatus Eremiobacteraeota bacterium]